MDVPEDERLVCTLDPIELVKEYEPAIARFRCRRQERSKVRKAALQIFLLGTDHRFGSRDTLRGDTLTTCLRRELRLGRSDTDRPKCLERGIGATRSRPLDCAVVGHELQSLKVLYGPIERAHRRRRIIRRSGEPLPERLATRLGSLTKGRAHALHDLQHGANEDVRIGQLP